MRCACGHSSADECRELFNAVMVREFSDFRYSRLHRLTVDTYSLQHPDPYLISAKSFAAHLSSLCVFMEHGGDRRLLRMLQQWLNGQKRLRKPALLEQTCRLTIAHLAVADSPEAHAKRLLEWAAQVWQAYAAYHELARQWITRAKTPVGQRRHCSSS